MAVERGVIRNRNYATQIRDFSGLRYGNITPTDCDGLIEYHDMCFVYIETKYEDASLPFGQELALERACDDHRKPTITIIASHKNTGDIDVANTEVTKYRFRRKWIRPDKPIKTKELIDRFLHWVETGRKLNNGNA